MLITYDFPEDPKNPPQEDFENQWDTAWLYHQDLLQDTEFDIVIEED